MEAGDMESVNRLDFEEFAEIFGNIIEHCPMIAAGVWSSRPFISVESFHTAVCRLVDQLPFNAKEGILRCHPDLAGRLSRAGALTSESTNEQQAAGLLALTAEEQAHLSKYNKQYKDKFGFPFVICARENKKQAIMEGLANRCNNSLEQEVLTGVEEVKKISFLRLKDIVSKLQSNL